MYIPSAFNIEDTERLARFIQQHSFATVVTHSEEGVPFASHAPILYDPEPNPSGRLLGHLARANPQWQHFGHNREVLVIFHGPHAYVSPRWYATEPAVPTWNYAVVHVYGRTNLITDEASLEELVQRMVRFYEGDHENSWAGDLPTAYKSKQLKAIVGFEIGITRFEGKFKLGQNRSKCDIAGAYTALSQSARPEDRQLAEFMKAEGLVEE
jgi:transcriptional regulator